jgi:excisionase family DNA binding protein
MAPRETERKLLTPQEAAQFLRLNPRTVVRLAREGKIPAVKVGTRWRFPATELQARLTVPNREVAARPRPSLTAMDFGLSRLIRPESVIVDLAARERNSALVEIVSKLADAGTVPDAPRFLALLAEREDMMSTVIAPGVAIPHPRRAAQGMFDESVIAVGISRSGVDFGADVPVRVIFVICAADDRSHLHILARLSRVLKETPLAKRLMYAGNCDDVIRIVTRQEELVAAGEGLQR